MLTDEMVDILNRSRKSGWLVEPEAKRLCTLAGLPVPRFVWAGDLSESLRAAGVIGYPLVAKIVSPAIIHKSEVEGVAVGLADERQLTVFFEKMSSLPGFAGLLLEEKAAGIELIAGAKIDAQFGLIIVLGIGGTAVEIYHDVAIRMAPLTEKDVHAMLHELRGERLLTGYRGKEAVDREKLVRFLVDFAALMTDMAPFIESVDLNPLLCSAEGCVIADARIMLGETFAATGETE
ncbi:MAG: acetate--CoA ligase family protein [Deltaproteobacteria bacterium]|nr:acetate--CoA ligase family protein [Deltaproteobacteria bacterium]